jgi:hypothetical protein
VLRFHSRHAAEIVFSLSNQPNQVKIEGHRRAFKCVG